MFKRMLCVLALFLWAGEAFAAHPLVTDDTATQGTGKFQIEAGGEYSHKKKDTITEDTTSLAPQFSAGISEGMDLIMGVPYQSVRTKEPGAAATEDGVTDASLQLKWRFYDKEGLSLALKPGMTVPLGNDEKGMGTGRVTCSVFFITTKEFEPATIHLNLGYERNENRLDQRRDIYYASIAGEWKVAKDLRFVADTGIERNADKSSNVDPAFILGGMIYSFTKNLDVDCGIKGWWNNLDEDYALLAGITWRF